MQGKGHAGCLIERPAVRYVMPPREAGERSSGQDWRDFAVPVKDVEELTGYNFFTNLPPDLAKDLRTRKPETRAARTKPSTPGAKEDDKPPKKVEGLELPGFKPGCIVGNKKSKIYHTPTGSGYEKAKTSTNAVFFKTADDAEKAGYKRAKR